MSDLDAFLAGIVAEPHNTLRWLVMADYLEENGEPERAELVRVHRELLRTCTATRETKARKQLHARMMELMRAGVQPCIPQRTIMLPGGVELRMSFIPPGSFLMGSPKSERYSGEQERRHRVTLTNGFWLGQTSVTQTQWRAVTGTNPSHFKGDELPVEMVNWEDAQAFCTGVMEVKARLPTEAEWEYAARAGTTTPFYWGTELNGTQANCNGNHPYGTEEKGPRLLKTACVTDYVAVSPHPWRLADMCGNVEQWCSDWYASYPKGAITDPIPEGDNYRYRIARGGSWGYGAAASRAARRGFNTPEFRSGDLGFRIAASA